MNGSAQVNSDLKFVDEKFEVIPSPAHIKHPGEDTASPGTTPGLSGISSPSNLDYSEDDLMFITETFWNIPCIFFEKIPPRDPDKVKKFNTQFFKYCRKKGINPWDYFFDEFPLAMSGLGMCMGIWRDYKEQYKSNGKDKTSKEDKKLSSDFEHEKEIADKKEQDVKSGIISTAPEIKPAS